MRLPAIGSRTRVKVAAVLLGSLAAIHCDSPLSPEAAIARVEITEARDRLIEGDTARFAAVPRDRAGVEVPGVTVHWSSSDTLVLTVDGAGLVHARTAGSALVAARAGAGAATVTVLVQGAPRSLLVPASYRLPPGDTQRLAVLVLDAHNNILDHEVEFTSSNPAVADVDAAGLVRALGYGVAVITARSRGASGETRIDVIDPADCATPGGTTHVGQIGADVTWLRRDGPHRVPARLEIADGLNPPEVVVTVEPGTAVCFADSATLVIGHRGALRALGTAALPITFRPDSPGGTWSLVRGSVFFGGGPPASAFRHLDMSGGSLEWHGAVDIDSSTIRGGGGLTFGGLVRLADMLVEDASVTMRDGMLTFEGTTIRRGSLVLWSYGSSAQARLVSGTIEDSPGIGLHMVADWRRFPRIVEYGMLRITGGASYPAQLTVEATRVVLATAGQQNALLGNARDTLLVYGETDQDVTIRPGLPWMTEFAPYASAPHLVRRLSLVNGATLRMEPGAVLIAGLHIVEGRLLAIGTAAAPVVIRDPEVRRHGSSDLFGAYTSSIYLGSTEVQQSVIRHAELYSASVTSHGAHQLVIDSSVVADGSILLRSAGSRITATRMHRPASTAAAAVLLEADDVVMTGTTIVASPRAGVLVTGSHVILRDCHIEGSAEAGVRVSDGENVRINDCNLVDNAGPGVENRSVHVVDATRNWWGHEDGAEAGDGVSGLVLTRPHRTTPLTIVAPSRPLGVGIVPVVPVAAVRRPDSGAR